MMIQKPIDSIVKSDLLYLIDNSVLEKKTLDYKVNFSGNSDEDKREFLKDITSFANSSGGDIIYGIKEENGVPVELVGIPNEEVDAKIRWIEDLVRQAVQPRIPGIKIQPIDLGEGLAALVVRIPKSWRSPHCVTFKNWSRFFARSSNGVYQLDIDELRNAFILSETLGEKISSFRNNRIASIVADETGMPLYSSSNIILHIIPISAFAFTRKDIDLKAIYNGCKISPICSGAYNRRINFDGIFIYSVEMEKGKTDSYVQLYKNGIIEAVESKMLPFKDKSIPISYEAYLIRSTKEYIEFLKELDIELPFFIYVTLTGVKGYFIPSSQRFFSSNQIIDKEILNPSVMVLDDFNTDIDVLLRPIFDGIWNAAGFTHSLNYNENGRFEPKY
jgi:hypothetical protein